MSEAPGDGDREGSPYIRLPWPVVAGGLLIFLAAALGFGLYANRNLRPLTGPASSTGPTPIAAAAAPASAATAMPMQDVRTPQSASAPAATAVAIPTATERVPTTLPATATAVPAPTARPTVSPELAAEIGDAYRHYWQIRAEALFDLDASHLPEVMAGEHLVSVETFIEQLRSEGHALQTDVDHKYAIVQASANEAEVADTYTDYSVYVDPVSHAALTEPANDVLQEEYQMSRIDGSWRVVSLVRAP